jgi:outer membrane protein
MKKSLALSFAFLVASALPSAVAAQQGQQGAPTPKILVIDRGLILQGSKVGQDVARQIQAYGNQAKNDIAAQAKSLQSQGQALQQQIAILAPDVKAQKIRDFESKQANLQASAQRKEAMIQGGFMQARQAIEQALGPIVMQIMKERGANMILDKNAVVSASDSRFDITRGAIDRLNQKLSAYKVQLVAPPSAPRR